MWECFKACLKAVLPGVGMITLCVILAGLAAAALSTGGLAALGAAGVGAIIGIPIAADAIAMLISCLLKCIADSNDDI